jgi:cobalamin biosynthesis protein CbiD
MIQRDVGTCGTPSGPRRGWSTGVVGRAGPGVGTVTKPGLPLEVGEPPVNPVPLAMMRAAVAAAHGAGGDVTVVDGEELARHTWNPRMGTLGGLSILGTTGTVVPYVVVIDRAGQVVGRAGPRG